MNDLAPPRSLDVEAAMLAAMLHSDTALGNGIAYLHPGCFFDPGHRAIFEAVTAVVHDGRRVDIVSTAQQLKEMGMKEQAVTLTADIATGKLGTRMLAGWEIQKLLELWMLRETMTAGQEMYMAAADEGDPFDVQQACLERLHGLMASLSGDTTTGDRVAGDVVEHLATLKAGDITGLATGLPVLDRMSAGWQPSDLVIIAGRPSMGKTALALLHVMAALEAGHPVGVFSLEMSPRQLIQRMLLARAGVDAQRARTGQLRERELEKVAKARDGFRGIGKRLHLDGRSRSLAQITARARLMHRRHGCNLFVVDYLQLVQHDTKESEALRLGRITTALKGLAKDLDVPVLLLSQLSRAVEKRGGSRRPQMSDLRDSGRIEEDADVVMFVYRPEYYAIAIDPDTQMSTEGMAHLIIAKQRQGPVGSVMVGFEKRLAWFDDRFSVDGALAPPANGTLPEADTASANVLPLTDAPF